MTDASTDRTAVDEAADADRDAMLTQQGRDGGPIDENDMRAADGLAASPQTAESYDEMLERGRNQRGEGRIS